MAMVMALAVLSVAGCSLLGPWAAPSEPFGDFSLGEFGGIDGRQNIVHVRADGVALLVSRMPAAGRLSDRRRTAPTSIALVTKSLLDLCRIHFHLTCAVAGPRPEEASQTVATAPRHDVDVQMRDRLADDVVDRDEGSLRSEGIN